MTRLFIDGGEFGDTLFWSSLGQLDADNGVFTTQKRSGAYSYAINGTEGHVRWLEKQFTAISEFYYRFAVWPTASQNTDISICIAKSGSTQIGYLKVSSDGKLHVYVNATEVTTSTLTVPKGNWTLIEWHLKIADSSGVSEVKIDGVLDPTYTGDTKPGSETTVDRVRHCSYAWERTYYDDIAMNDTVNTDGKNDNSWPGDGRIEILVPSGNGTLSQWTGSDSNSTDNYQLIDDIPASSTDYVQDSTPGNKDRYAITDFTATGKQILRVWSEARAIDTVPEGAQMKIGLRVSSTDYMSSAISLPTTYNIVKGNEYKVNPDDSSAWEDADIDGIELVVETV